MLIMLSMLKNYNVQKMDSTVHISPETCFYTPKEENLTEQASYFNKFLLITVNLKWDRQVMRKEEEASA